MKPSLLIPQTLSLFIILNIKHCRYSLFLIGRPNEGRLNETDFAVLNIVII